MKTMPQYILDLAPFQGFGQTYVAKSLLVRLRDHIAGGGSFESFQKALLSLYKDKYMKYQLMYYSRWKDINTLDGATHCDPAPQFSTFEDPLGWAVSTPSVDVLRKIYLEDHEARCPWLDKRLIFIPPGPILKGDASHKAAKLIFSEDRPLCGSIFTLMNGRNEVRTAHTHKLTCNFFYVKPLLGNRIISVSNAELSHSNS